MHNKLWFQALTFRKEKYCYILNATGFENFYVLLIGFCKHKTFILYLHGSLKKLITYKCKLTYKAYIFFYIDFYIIVQFFYVIIKTLIKIHFN